MQTQLDLGGLGSRGTYGGRGVSGDIGGTMQGSLGAGGLAEDFRGHRGSRYSGASRSQRQGLYNGRQGALVGPREPLRSFTGYLGQPAGPLRAAIGAIKGRPEKNTGTTGPRCFKASKAGENPSKPEKIRESPSKPEKTR